MVCYVFLKFWICGFCRVICFVVIYDFRVILCVFFLVWYVKEFFSLFNWYCMLLFFESWLYVDYRCLCGKVLDILRLMGLNYGRYCFDGDYDFLSLILLLLV